MTERSFAHYSVIDKIGQGGMGEVFRARDTRLGRDVALKFLPDSVAGDPERLARFEREARLLAALNHPHIAAIHGFEQVDDKRFLVLELVEGEDLAVRLQSGPLPVKEALQIARQVAEALETAHESGIIHRDLKPANIALTADGQVKVLDFGLAKAWDTAPTSVDLSHSPTVMASSPTMAGVILGTAAYMSPEQARGRAVDKRSDVFSFGIVLFEMLTAGQVFLGETVSDTLAAVLRAEPDWNKLPKDTPRVVEKLLRRCLEKDPKVRLRDIGEARITLERALRGEDDADPAASTAAPVTARSRGVSSMVSWALVGLLVIVSIAATAGYFREAKKEQPILQVELSPPKDVRMNLRGVHPGPATISPDGRAIVFTGRHGGTTLLYVRELDGSSVRALPGTQDAGYPFWSPDSRNIGFIAGGKLRRVPITGGPPLSLCDAAFGKGGSWNEDGTIIFPPSYNTPIHSVSANGGVSEAVTVVRSDASENSHRFPCFLPDGDHFIYMARTTSAQHTIRVASLSGKDDKVLIPATSNAQYADGYLFFMRESTLMARSFDAKRLEFTGDPVPVADPVRQIPGAIYAIFSVSPSGFLVYQEGTETSGNRVVWRDAAGTKKFEMKDTYEQNAVSISPDGKTVAMDVFDNTGGTADIWLYDTARDIRTRFTFDPANDQFPVWSPDGKQVAYLGARNDGPHIFVKAVSGGSDEKSIWFERHLAGTGDWSPDGKYIVYARNDSLTSLDLWALPVDGTEKPFSLVASSYTEVDAKVSPDGRWLAYASDESGRFEIYVTSFPTPGRKWQISSDGGRGPAWMPRTEGIVYLDLAQGLRHVALTSGTTLVIGENRKWFEAPSATTFDLYPDGKQLLLIEDIDDREIIPLTLLVNWPAELRRHAQR